MDQSDLNRNSLDRAMPQFRQKQKPQGSILAAATTSALRLAAVLGLMGATALWLASRSQAADQPTCAKTSGVLGVSRVVEIDTKNGARFGLQQYKQNDFLKDKEVVLTFDDGPARVYTKPILEALQKQCTKATFFMVGRMAKSDPQMVREVARRGHTIATHTWSHPNLYQRSKKRGIRQIELGISAITKALGRPPAPFFRFPYLADPKAMLQHLKSRQISVFSIDVDSKDYRTRSGATVTRKILRDLKHTGKGIILFHDIQRSTARALPDLLKKLKKRGYKVVHLVAKAKATTIAKFDAMADKKNSAEAHKHVHTRSFARANRSAAGLGRRSKRQPRQRRFYRKAHKKAASTARSLRWSKDIFHGG